MFQRINEYIKNYIQSASSNPHICHGKDNIYLGNGLMLCKLTWGGWVVAPTWNLDVAIGAIRDGIIEASLTEFVLRNVHTGDNFINVGANFGYYISLGGSLVGPTGHVWGFEPNPSIFRILMKTLYYSGGINHTTIYNRAVSDVDDRELEFFFDYQHLGGGRHVSTPVEMTDKENLFWDTCDINLLINKYGMMENGKSLYTHFFQKTITLDTAIQDKKIDFLLCDAETAEPYIILGAKDIIDRSPNIKIVFEYTSLNYKQGTDEQKTSIVNMFDFLDKQGFTIRKIQPDLENGKVILSEKISSTSLTHGDFGVENFLASRA